MEVNKMRDCFRRNKKTGEITSFSYPLKNLTEAQRDCAIEMLRGFAVGAHGLYDYEEVKNDLWNVVRELERGERTKRSRRDNW